MDAVIGKSEHMGRLIRYIESNLASGLDAGLLSRMGFVSHTQLYRDFYSLTGHSVKEYIRKRRLSNALALVKASELPLARVAYECGYSSQQSFCRAVRQTLGVTPLAYQSSGVYYFFPPYEGRPPQAVCVASDTIPETLCVKFHHASPKNIESAAVGAFLSLVPQFSGRIFGRNGKQEGARFCYELYITEFENAAVLSGSGVFELTEKKGGQTAVYATTAVWNREDKINAAWDYLYAAWLPDSMFAYTGEPYYEEYLLKNGEPVRLKLWLPIKKRSEQTKITLVSNPGLCFLTAGAKGRGAEKTAAQTVLKFLCGHYPYTARTSKEFYLRKQADAYTCGVRVNAGVRAPQDGDVESVSIKDGEYLVLESGVMGDYDRHAGLLLSFARNNGMRACEEGIFAVYDARDSYESPKIRLYCPVMIGTK